MDNGQRNHLADGQAEGWKPWGKQSPGHLPQECCTEDDSAEEFVEGSKPLDKHPLPCCTEDKSAAALAVERKRPSKHWLQGCSSEDDVQTIVAGASNTAPLEGGKPSAAEVRKKGRGWEQQMEQKQGRRGAPEDEGRRTDFDVGTDRARGCCPVWANTAGAFEGC
jgi:hypothetical protein